MPILHRNLSSVTPFSNVMKHLVQHTLQYISHLFIDCKAETNPSECMPGCCEQEHAQIPLVILVSRTKVHSLGFRCNEMIINTL